MSDLQTGGHGPCPACHGEGEMRLGRLTLLCDECGGEGEVGGHEESPTGADGYRQPQDGEAYDPDLHGPLPAARDYPAWRPPRGPR
jgi:hypothetical protein